MYRRFISSSCCFLLACAAHPVEKPVARIPVAKPPGVYALARTPSGPLSQHEILVKRFPARITGTDHVRHLITFSSELDPAVTVSTRTNPALLTLGPGAPVEVIGFTSLLYSVVDPQAVDLANPQQATRVTQEAKIGLPADAQITRVNNTIAQVLGKQTSEKKIILQAPDGSLVDLPVRYSENFKRISVGDTIALTRVEALAVKPAD